MPRDGQITKQNILDAAEKAVLERGFAGTSVDEILERASISRGTFFYHFPTKDDLARALIHRHAATDREMVERFMERAERLARDPLQQVLVFIGLYEDLAPGCLFASFSYEAGLFDEETKAMIQEAVDHWRDRVGTKLQRAIERHPPRIAVNGETLADLAYSVFEGAMIMARVRKDPRIMAEHLSQYRNYLELAFGVVEGAEVSGGD
jgi:TetR/AcrR family transcriptional repressor of nem operon